MNARPRYVQPSDEVEERLIADAAAKAWGYRAYKLPDSYVIDFAMYIDDGKRKSDGTDYVIGKMIKGYLEAKKRDYTFGKGNGYRMAMNKAIKAREYLFTAQTASTMAIRFDCGNIYWAMFRDAMPGCVIAGRGDRNDAADIEPHIVVPWDKFKLLPSTA